MGSVKDAEATFIIKLQAWPEQEGGDVCTRCTGMSGIALSKLQLRAASEEDVELLAEMNGRLLVDEGHRSRMTAAELRERMRQWLETGDYEAFIFLNGDGNPVGYCLYALHPQHVHLRQFYIAEEFRSRGVGRRCVALALDTWPADRPVVLDVLVNNARALGFWRAVGFADYAVRMELQREH